MAGEVNSSGLTEFDLEQYRAKLNETSLFMTAEFASFWLTILYMVGLMVAAALVDRLQHQTFLLTLAMLGPLIYASVVYECATHLHRVGRFVIRLEQKELKYQSTQVHSPVILWEHSKEHDPITANVTQHVGWVGGVKGTVLLILFALNTTWAILYGGLIGVVFAVLVLGFTATAMVFAKQVMEESKKGVKESPAV